MREIVLYNDELRLRILPELGGKIASLLGLRDGREHLLQPPRYARRPAEYGAAFELYDTSGFDECFPTVGNCVVADDTCWPDHGELWSVAWEVGAVSSTSLALTARGTSRSYSFTRTLSLRGAEVCLKYQVQNSGGRDLPYLWSCHPLLSVAPGDRVVLPSEVSSVAVEWSAGERLRRRVPWNEELARLGAAERQWAEKVFAGPLSEGWCRIDYCGGGSLTFNFCPQEAPYVGLWLCQGGWPVQADGSVQAGHYTVALEPCTAPCDRLDTALERGYARKLGPGEQICWGLSLTVRPGPRTLGTQAGRCVLAGDLG